MPNSARDIVRSVLPRQMADEIWSSQYDKVLPIEINDFELSAVLPAVFYMFRFGKRRGRGNFLDTFDPQPDLPMQKRRPVQKRRVTIDRVAAVLSANPELYGFEGSVEKAVLGDMLLCFCLENARRTLGRDRQIQRVAPVHFLANWVDLPDTVTALRSVPEMIVAMLANQKKDTHIEQSKDEDRTWFPVGRDLKSNVLLRAFSQGVYRKQKDDGDDPLANLASDRFDEGDDSVGLDQLLMIRVAQQMGRAPAKVLGKNAEKIPNQRPIAENAARQFSEDISKFVQAYADITPRHAFIDMLETCISIGMTATLTSVVSVLFTWSDTGTIPSKHEQAPAAVFVDCSNGVDRRLRGRSEQSLDDLMRRVERIPVVLMILRILDYLLRDNKRVKARNVPTAPYATEWLNLLGDVLHERHDEARFILLRLEDDGDKLADALRDQYPAAAETLRNEGGEPNSIRRLASALTPLLQPDGRNSRVARMVDATLQIGRRNGLARKRRTTRGAQASRGGRRGRDVRSLVFADSVLDHLVHLQLLCSVKGGGQKQRALSYSTFLRRIRERYGLCIDAAPPGMAISNELLQANRAILERRLRDLGLLTGVNDAEAMKRLKPRFELKDD